MMRGTERDNVLTIEGSAITAGLEMAALRPAHLPTDQTWDTCPSNRLSAVALVVVTRTEPLAVGGAVTSGFRARFSTAPVSRSKDLSLTILPVMCGAAASSLRCVLAALNTAVMFLVEWGQRQVFKRLLVMSLAKVSAVHGTVASLEDARDPLVSVLFAMRRKRPMLSYLLAMFVAVELVAPSG